ncbi:MAG: TetR/AcrR family transcriptional regulator [Bacilli bacterium]|nr:TetR/AcrR family transcriptional regulator [Bacilli bacterium]
MPTNVRITKNMILDTAFDIARSGGLEDVSNREIASRLGCSIRPIYYQFKNTDELKGELYAKIEKYFYTYLMDNMRDDIPPYKQVGINYIRFAREESHLFRILFMSETNLLPMGFVTKDEDDFRKLAKFIKFSTKLSDDDIKTFHVRMWLFAHGIASLVASNTVVFSDTQIEKLLSYEFQALMLLEENPDNKWNIVNYKGGYYEE